MRVSNLVVMPRVGVCPTYALPLYFSPLLGVEYAIRVLTPSNVVDYIAHRTCVERASWGHEHASMCFDASLPRGTSTIHEVEK